MFKSWTKGGRDIITLFHKPSSPASTRVFNLLKQSSAMASETATIDQASDHTTQNQVQRSEFDLDITEADPTPDQVKSILEYLGGGSAAAKLVKGASGESDAVSKIKSSPDAFQRPVIVDWNNARAVIGESESEIMKLLNVSIIKKGNDAQQKGMGPES